MKHLQEYINNSTVNSRLELEAKIAELEQQLAECRDSLTNNEQRHQKQLTVVGALATAIKQTLTAIKLAAETGEPGITDSFWQEIQDIKDGNYDEKELLSLPTNKEGDDNNNPSPTSQGPHTHNSLVKLNLAGVKEVASSLDISVKDVKQYGSTRLKLSWITAILEKQNAENKVESNGKVETVKPLVTSPPVETNDVVDVDSTVVESTTVESTTVDSSTIEEDNDYEGW